MPELPEVETVCRGLEPVLVGARFLDVEQRRDRLRFPLPDRFADRLRGQMVRAVNRRAKYILAELDGGDVLAIHLGMSGRFTIERRASKAKKPGRFFHAAGTDPAHDHLVFRMSNGATVRYNDVRRFGYMTLVAAEELSDHPLFRDLGVEPLGNALTAAHLATACAGKQASLKAALMDQRIIAGLGNIYVCEALFRAGLSPRHKAAILATKAGAPSVRAERLVTAIQAILRDAIEAGGSTLRDYHQADGSLGYFQHSFAVYGRAGQICARPGCGGIIRRVAQTGRSTFYCPRCQH
ncbi:MAG: bifunctional DNA-formamidopyrimidine glycosylase/DNA-(apurinic or apyrimidinic site) lyase [Methyloligellaceae bacterium]